MATKKKLLQAAAGQAGGAGLNVEEVFSTYLYEGTGSRIRIQNGVNVLNEGGLVWIKDRSATQYHYMIDTARGIYGVDGVTDSKYLSSNTTTAETSSGSSSSQVGQSNAYPTPAIPEDGFYINSAANVNGSGNDYASWTFRKAPKFFDVVTYTGDGVDNRTIAHNLGSVPGMIIVKSTSSADQWPVYHRSLGTGALRLNLTNAYNSADIWWKTTPTDSVFTVYGGGEVNTSGVDYVAYLFAHNDGDAEFGPDGDADIIKCGSFVGNGSTDGPEIDLGFEPQWILTKGATQSGNWVISDNMRGTVTGGDDEYLLPNSSGAAALQNNYEFNSTGFKVTTTNLLNTSGETYIYIAIRRGPMAVPESATDVFTPVLATSSGTFTAEAGFPVDLNWYGRRSVADGGFTWDRLRGANYLITNSTNAEVAYSAASFDSNTAFYLDGLTGDYSDFMTYNWRRAPNYFDVVAYSGNGTAGRTVSHNLGVAPEMIWVKARNQTYEWVVHHKDVGFNNVLYLNLTNAEASNPYFISASSDTDFTTGYSGLTSTYSNQSGTNYIAYLFASLDGVSKVGSYTGDGTTGRVIDCGFSSGARFILIKRTDSTGDWYAWDSVRGIVAGNDPYLLLNVNAAEVTSTDFVDPDSSGFAVNGTTVNASGGSYIFYAIA